MATDCRYTVEIDGVKIPFTESDFKAYLLKGGKKAFDKISTQELSAENRRRLDNAVDAIVAGTTTTKSINEFIDKQKTKKETKEKLKAYLKEKLRQRRKGSYEGMTDSQKLLHDLLEDKYLNGEISYEEVQDELSYIIGRQEDETAKGLIEEVKDIFFKRNQRRQEKEIKKEEVKEDETFEDEIKNLDAGLSDNSLTVFQSDKRLIEGGSEFMDDNSFLINNDQFTALFELEKYASDLNYILGKFQQQYGEKNYLKEMERFVSENAKADKSANATISVAIALNNHLDYLLSKENVPNRAYLQNIKDNNSKLSQTLGRKFSLGLNALRVWNNRETSDYAWTGVITPDLRNERDEITQVLGDEELSDVDLLEAEEGNVNYFEEETEPEQTKAKKPGFITRYRMKKEAKKIQAKNPKDLKKEIDEQKNKCK